jgi:hypothetical protein
MYTNRQRHRLRNSTTMGKADTMILPCMTMTTIHMIATAPSREAASKAMKTARLTGQGTTSTDTRPLATMSNWMTMMTMICGEPGAGVFTRFLSVSLSRISAFSSLAAHGNTHAFCPFQMFQNMYTQAVFSPFSYITHIPSNVFKSFRVPNHKPGSYLYLRTRWISITLRKVNCHLGLEDCS